MPRATSRVFDAADDQPELLGHASDEDFQEERNLISPRSPLGCTDQEIEDNVENLSAKTQWAQEQAVTKIYDLLRKHVCLDGLQQRQLSLFEGLRRIILTPKYSAKLRADAARTAAAGLLALDDVPFSTFNDLAESIIRVITDRVTPEAVVVAGLRTLLIAALLNPHADDDTAIHPKTLLPVFSKFISSSANANPTIVGTAVECLSLLCGHGNVNDLKNHKKILAKLVSKPMPEIVVPSAEALALLSQQGAVEDDEELQGVLDGVEAMIENLNKESIRTAHKDTRKIQRAALRRVLAQLTGESGPQEKLVVGQRTVNFQLWTQVLAIDRLRDLLGGGLPIHLMLNPRAQEMLGLEDSDLKQGKKRSKAEKALMMADLAAAAKERRLQRNQRTRQFGSVLDEE